jgi:DNA-binding MarR family transcriptional regulator
MKELRTLQSSDELWNLWWIFLQTRDAVFKVRHRDLLRHGVTLRQSGVLTIVTLNGRTTAAEIARWIMQEPSSVTGLLNRMEKQGLIKRIVNPHKVGPVGIVLTDKGRRIYQKTQNRETVHEMMSVLSASERKNMESYLKKIRLQAMKMIKRTRGDGQALEVED